MGTTEGAWGAYELAANERASRPRIIAGSGRSGTTWILDAIAEVNALRPVFEPLHPQAVPAAAPYAGRYLGPDDDASSLKSFLDEVFAGRYDSLWTDYRVRPNTLAPGWKACISPAAFSGFVSRWREAIAQYRRYKPLRYHPEVVVKVIRGNLILSWLRQQYDARIVFVTRHPGAVLESRLRIGGRSWDPAPILDLYRTPGVLGDIGERYQELLHRPLEPAGAHTLIWCIENQLPLEQAEEENITVVYYEQLMEDPERQWQRIVDAYDLQFNPWFYDVVKKPSQQARLRQRDEAAPATKNWRDRLGPRNMTEMERVLDLLGVDVYRADEMMPLASRGAA